MPEDMAGQLAPSFVALKRAIEGINFKPEIKITVPEVKIPKIVVPDIKIPEIKVPDIHIEPPTVKVNVDKVKVTNFPTPEPIDYSKITKPLIEAIKKYRSVAGSGGGSSVLQWYDEDNTNYTHVSQTEPLPANIYGNILIPKKYDYIGFAYPAGDTEVLTFKTGGAGGTTIATLTIVYTDATKENVEKLTKT
jgi:hypothetical protein